MNEKQYKEKSETLLSEKKGLERTVSNLNDHLEHLQTTIDMIEDDDENEDEEDLETQNEVVENAMRQCSSFVYTKALGFYFSGVAHHF